MASSPSRSRKHLAIQGGSLSLALDASLADQLELAEGTEVEIRVEDGCLIVEPVRPKILAPVSDVGARDLRNRKVAESIDEVMRDHRGLFAMLAR